MKDYPYMPGWRQNKENNKPTINHSILMLTTYGVAEGEWDGNEWTQYRWSCKVKDSDVLYWIHLEDLTQLEKEGQPLQQEQPLTTEKVVEQCKKFGGNPEVIQPEELEKKIDDWYNTMGIPVTTDALKETARHFYELGLKAAREDKK